MRGDLRRPARPREPLRDGPTMLRAWRESDAPTVTQLCGDPKIVRWIGVPDPYTEADAREFIAQRDPDHPAGRRLHFAIVDEGAPGRPPVGSIALIRFAWEDRRCEVGYWLGAPGRGRGHATRAVGLICGWGFRGLGLERIELLAASENLASQQVAQRAGFAREALLRSHSATADGRDDMVCFGLLATDPPPPRGS